MRLAGLLLSLFIVSSLCGCSSKGDASNTPDPAALKAQQELVARRDALMAERKKWETELEKVDAEIQEAKAGTGGDPTKLEKLEQKKADLTNKIQKNNTEDSSLDQQLSKVVAQTGDVASREAAIAAREKQLAAREAAFAEREARTLAQLTDAAKLFKESCNAGGSPAMIVQVPAPKGGSYSRTEVDGVYAKAKKIMRDRGLIPGDQWAGASLEADTQAALAKSPPELSTAFVTASQLVNYANQFKVDRGFVQAKINRLNKLVRSATRDEGVQKQLTDGLSDVMVKFGDGNHNAANAKLNQLFGLVR